MGAGGQGQEVPGQALRWREALEVSRMGRGCSQDVSGWADGRIESDTRFQPRRFPAVDRYTHHTVFDNWGQIKL